MRIESPVVRTAVPAFDSGERVKCNPTTVNCNA
jgi:hypothetical protein